MSDTPPGARDNSQRPAVNGASVTLRGSVEQIISRAGPDSNPGSDIVHLVIEGAEPLYRELRIQNPFQDANGNVITLQADSEVEITIRARNAKVRNYSETSG